MTADRRSAVLLLGFVLLTAGCDKPPPPADPPSSASLQMPADSSQPPGRRAFNKSGCMGCHTIGGQAGPGGPKRKGPDLAAVGKDPAHTPEWLADYIRDPQAKNPESKMPPFQGKISDDDFKTLVEYLASLK